MKKSGVRGFLLFVLIALLTGASSSQAQKQKPAKPVSEETDDVVRVNTTLVTLPVSVTDRHGRFIADLKQEQFHLYEDGNEQQIAHFESADQPFTVALLFDTSDSTKFKLANIQDAAAAFVDQLRPDDRVIVIAFDKRVTVLCEATTERLVVDRAIHSTQTGGGTSLYSAVALVIRQRLNRIRGRKAIVLFTDGVDTTSIDATYQGTLRTAEELDALIYAIQYNTYDDLLKGQMEVLLAGQQSGAIVTARGEPLKVAYERADRYLRLMADKSGGRFFHADTLRHLKETFVHIAAELREQYSLGYYPNNQSSPGVKRELKVRLDVPNVAVRARRSYIYAPPNH